MQCRNCGNEGSPNDGPCGHCGGTSWMVSIPATGAAPTVNAPRRIDVTQKVVPTPGPTKIPQSFFQDIENFVAQNPNDYDAVLTAAKQGLKKAIQFLQARLGQDTGGPIVAPSVAPPAAPLFNVPIHRNLEITDLTEEEILAAPKITVPDSLITSGPIIAEPARAPFVPQFSAEPARAPAGPPPLMREGGTPPLSKVRATPAVPQLTPVDDPDAGDFDDDGTLSADDNGSF